MDFVESENNVRPYLRVKLENITLGINFLAIDPGHLATTGFIDIFWESPKNFTPRLCARVLSGQCRGLLRAGKNY
jgi:hypothetical protein